MWFVFVICILFCERVHGGDYIAPKNKETWSYVEVRPGAHMFWWLYYTNANASYTQRPLIIWLQGGPGASSTGYGNFMEIGPIDVGSDPRKVNWVNEANVLFVDNPVGTGFSYVQNKSLYARNNSMIADDLVTLFSSFLKKVPEFQKVSTYIFGESYGGKMAVGFAKALNKAAVAGKVKCNLQGVALGDSWISPVESMLSWPPFLYATSFLDEEGYQKVQKLADATADEVKKGNGKAATELWMKTESLVENLTHGVDWYNILHLDADVQSLNAVTVEKKPRRGILSYDRHVGLLQGGNLKDLMNGVIRRKLRIIPENVTWGGQSDEVFAALEADFMEPVTDDVEFLLNRTNLSVIVYNGQLDLIVATQGTENWVMKLLWPGVKGWRSTERVAIPLPHIKTAAFYKQYKNLCFYWILQAGHMVPADAPEAMLEAMKHATNIHG
ncbi:unnamed protein product [Darwinula stevensoni]|uniref:Carboxypeptidase n=1 Tax=Darwinula stevensoni TaxID=69355 RepID=A0A7R9FT39_9CRUS|nr:unnamed protein product [Darwinula stevensoni]CAG0904612.1 unnamed protein product [Darwinula stevensoni]